MVFGAITQCDFPSIGVADDDCSSGETIFDSPPIIHHPHIILVNRAIASTIIDIGLFVSNPFNAVGIWTVNTGYPASPSRVILSRMNYY